MTFIPPVDHPIIITNKKSYGSVSFIRHSTCCYYNNSYHGPPRHQKYCRYSDPVCVGGGDIQPQQQQPPFIPRTFRCSPSTCCSNIPIILTTICHVWTTTTTMRMGPPLVIFCGISFVKPIRRRRPTTTFYSTAPPSTTTTTTTTSRAQRFRP